MPKDLYEYTIDRALVGAVVHRDYTHIAERVILIQLIEEWKKQEENKLPAGSAFEWQILVKDCQQSAICEITKFLTLDVSDIGLVFDVKGEKNAAHN